MRMFSVVGPSQSGKTTLVQALASLEGHAPKPMESNGSVGIHQFRFMDEDWTAVDIAGGADNLYRAGPALAASDAAVVCVPADAEAAVLSAPYLRLIEESGIPAILFINRIDQATDRVADIVAALQTYCVHSIVLRQVPMRQGDRVVGAVDLISERAWQYREGEPSKLVEIPADLESREQEARTELLESLADHDDALLEQLVEDREPMAAEVYDIASRLLQHHELVPAFLGAASHCNGVHRLMKSLRHEAPGPEVARERLSTKAVAVAAHADFVKHLGKVVLVRAFEAGLKGGQTLAGAPIGSLTEIDARTQAGELAAGDIGLTVKTDHLNLGDYYARDAARPLPDWAQPHPSAHRMIVSPTHERDEARLSTALEQLRQCDPGLTAEPDPQSGHIVLGTQGTQHLRRVTQQLADGFGIEIALTPVPPSLRETISRPVEKHHRHRKQSGGAGQFADVVIELAPLPRGTGFLFEEHIKGGAVPRNYIPSVEAGVQDALVSGPNGHPVVDLQAVLKDGKHHSVDSSDYAFRTAGKNAVREALVEAGPIVLQPILRVEIHLPSVFTGALVQVVSSLKGQVEGFEGHPAQAGWDVFTCLLPTAALDSLFNSLGSSTRGTAWFTASFDHYQEARGEELAELEGAGRNRA
ncbi:MAG: elongation factor G [Rhodobacteraceae bacterium]|nr:elongation factor G [Paracoccaceae bacterium]